MPHSKPAIARAAYIVGTLGHSPPLETIAVGTLALGDASAGHLRDCLRAMPSFTLFFVPEGLAFIDYVAALPVPELVHSVGRFERAM